MREITCNRNHGGNTHLTRYMGGWECDGCGTHYREFIVTAKSGMTPFTTETSMAAARASARAARRLGLDGHIIPRF